MDPVESQIVAARMQMWIEELGAACMSATQCAPCQDEAATAARVIAENGKEGRALMGASRIRLGGNIPAMRRRQ